VLGRYLEKLGWCYTFRNKRVIEREREREREREEVFFGFISF
jgi:hypothetical protein